VICPSDNTAVDTSLVSTTIGQLEVCRVIFCQCQLSTFSVYCTHTTHAPDVTICQMATVMLTVVAVYCYQ